jgi:imidazolonepropionase-like amidohydrolase
VIAIENVSVVRVDRGDVVAGRTVLIEGNRIARIGPAGRVRVPAGATRVDGAGKYLAPGLWDMHVHAWQQSLFQDVLLANGITGIREMGTGMDGIYGARSGVWAWRDAVRGGRTPGPRIVAAGMIINGGSPESPAAPFFVGAPTPEAGRAWVDSLAGRGADFIKVYSGLSAETYAAVARRAKERGLPFAGHAPASVGVVAAANAGQRGIEHLFDFLISTSTVEDSVRREIADALATGRGHPGGAAQGMENDLSDRLNETRGAAREAALIAALRRNRTWVTPTLVALVDPRGELPAAGVDSARLMRVPARLHFLIVPRDTPTAEALARGRRRFARQLELVRALHRAGVPLLAGSDPPNTFVYPGASLHEELELLVRAGLRPAEALRAATLEPARYLEATDSLGTVAAGKLADLLLLDANPLADIRNTRRIAAVVANGTLLTRDELEERLRRAVGP